MKIIKAEVIENMKSQVQQAAKKKGVTEAKFLRDAVKDALTKVPK